MRLFMMALVGLKWVLLSTKQNSEYLGLGVRSSKEEAARLTSFNLSPFRFQFQVSTFWMTSFMPSSLFVSQSKRSLVFNRYISVLSFKTCRSYMLSVRAALVFYYQASLSRIFYSYKVICSFFLARTLYYYYWLETVSFKSYIRFYRDLIYQTLAIFLYFYTSSFKPTIQIFKSQILLFSFTQVWNKSSQSSFILSEVLSKRIRYCLSSIPMAFLQDIPSLILYFWQIYVSPMKRKSLILICN